MTKQKKIMLLGGIYYLKPAIEAAHKLGLYVITADYLPNNPAHQWSDEYVNVSIIDKDAVLKVAREKEIDGILSYAVDPGVVTAAYVAEQMGLPFVCSYEMAKMMQCKSHFRQFLQNNGFNCPCAKGYISVKEALNDAENYHWPIIVKPVDSAGSKGVQRVDGKEKLRSAIEGAICESHSGEFIIEDFLQKVGFSCGSEVFTIDGTIVGNGIYDQYFDNEALNPYTPSAECWPSMMPMEYQSDMTQQLQRFFAMTNVKTGLFNVEFRLCSDGKVYLMEVSPRAGGNRLAEVLTMATGVDFPMACVRAAMGMPVEMNAPCIDGYWADVVLHASQEGILKSVEIVEELKPYVKDLTLYKQIGEHVNGFSAANAAIGSMFLRFDSRKQMDDFFEKQCNYIKVIVE